MINHKNSSIDTSNTELKKLTFDEAMDLVRVLIDNTLTKSPHIIRDYTKHLTGAYGKFIRAFSVLMCAEDKKGLIHPNAIQVAAAIEIIHLATLVHDDVIDNADIRRGIPTIQKKYGRKTAVICGDYLLCQSLVILNSIENKSEYIQLDIPDYMSKVCLGELNQHINNYNINLTISKYLKIIAGKTAALFEASFYGGAFLSECTEKDRLQLKRLGSHIGMIFQLTDDCMDFEKTVEVAAKPVQSDYEQGVITLPLIHALKNIPALKEKGMNEGLTREEINDAVNKTDGLGFTKLLVKKYYGKSVKIIDNLDINQEKRQKLISLLNKASRID